MAKETEELTKDKDLDNFEIVDMTAEPQDNPGKTLDEPNEELEQTSDELAIAKETPKQLVEKPKGSRFKRFISTKKGKIISCIVVFIVLITVLLAVPATRYGILGNFVKKTVKVSITDATTKKPVSQATVMLGNVQGKTDGSGKAELVNVPVGEYTLKITKKYYKDTETSYIIPVVASPKESTLEVTATGRQVVVNFANTITEEPLAKVAITVQGTSAITDEKGNATIVLPADKESLKGIVKLDGYNESEVEIRVTEQADANRFTVTPSGIVYYLSKQTGKVNVMKSNLDGTDAKVIVEGTGNENDHTTVLLAARDWKYLALSANRNGSKNAQIYLVEAATGRLTIIDEGEVEFRLIGWSDHKFLYSLTANNKQSWESKRQRIKSFDAETAKLAVLDETAAIGSSSYDAQYEQFADPYIVEDRLLYGKSWVANSSSSTLSDDKKATIMVVNLTDGQKQRSQEFTAQRSVYIQAKLYEPQEVYFRVDIDNAPSPSYFEYAGGTVKSVSNTDEKFYNTYYPTYLVSPNSEKTFWYEPRDGKNALFVGDKNGKDSKQLALQSEYTAYGWHSDKYILLSKNGSELFIAPSDKALSQPIKITNYHKPTLTFPGYGYGYGGNG